MGNSPSENPNTSPAAPATPPAAPATPPAAPAAPTTAPAAPDAGALSSKETAASSPKSFLDQVLDTIGVNQLLADYAKDHPEWARNILAQLGKEVKDYTTGEAKIDWEEAFRDVEISKKIGLLIQVLMDEGQASLSALSAQVLAKFDALNVTLEPKPLGDFFKTGALKSLRKALLGTDKYQPLESSNPHHEAGKNHYFVPVVGDLLSLAKTAWEAVSPSHEMEGALSRILPSFQGKSMPFPAQSRMVLPGRNGAPYAALKALGEKAGCTVSFFNLGETIPEPGAKDLQIIISDPAKCDKNSILANKVLYDSEIPCVFTSAVELCGVYAALGDTPEEAAKAAGIDNPSKDVLDLMNEVKVAAAAPATSSATSSTAPASGGGNAAASSSTQGEPPTEEPTDGSKDGETEPLEPAQA